MLIDRHTALPDGLRVRVRLPQSRDLVGVHALHARVGVAADDVALSRLLRADPRRRATVVAVAWEPGGELLVGYASGLRGAERPEVLVVDPVAGGPLRELLAAALAERSATWPGRRVA